MTFHTVDPSPSAVGQSITVNLPSRLWLTGCHSDENHDTINHLIHLLCPPSPSPESKFFDARSHWQLSSSPHDILGACSTINSLKSSYPLIIIRSLKCPLPFVCVFVVCVCVRARVFGHNQFDSDTVCSRDHVLDPGQPCRAGSYMPVIRDCHVCGLSAYVSRMSTAGTVTISPCKGTVHETSIFFQESVVLSVTLLWILWTTQSKVNQAISTPFCYASILASSKNYGHA